MIDKQLLEILRCPQDKSKLSQADDQLVTQINRAIDDKHLVAVGGHEITKHICGGLIRDAGDLMYPIFDQIPVMLPDEAIDLAQLQNQ
ncbi:MAG: Trm112 family protein [Planctomycetes bacterium]|nr:Trm112 family protein [Planctomycetota bacterium]